MQMKHIKLGLIGLAILGLSYFIYISLSRIEADPPEINVSNENEYIIQIESKIDSLSKLPDNKFYKGYYDEIIFRIEQLYKSEKLGSKKEYNEKQRNNLLNRLYAVYADKFIIKSFSVFRGAEWKREELEFIRSETKMLLGSAFLDNGSPVFKNLKDIQLIINKHDEISNFVAMCLSFSYSNTDATSRFPIEKIKNYLSRATAYRRNDLENPYVKNCARLQNALKGVPQALFIAHVRYLDAKISDMSNYYPKFNTHREYVRLWYNPLKSEISDLDNDNYNEGNFNAEYSRLLRKWESDNIRAYNHFNP